MGSNYRMIKSYLHHFCEPSKIIVHDYHYHSIHHSGLCIQSHQTDQDQPALTGLVVAAAAVVVGGSESLSWAR